MNKKTVKFFKADVGCYADSARGFYIGEQVVIPMAESCGFDAQSRYCDCDYCKSVFTDLTTPDGFRISQCEYYDEIQDEAERFLQELTEDGLWWGSSDNGDFGLWES